MPVRIYGVQRAFTPMNRFLIGLVALLCCTAVFAGTIAASNADYDISVDGSVDTPDRTVTLEGEEFLVSAIGVVSPGETISATVTTPTGVDYKLYLYNDEKKIVDEAADSGTFDNDYPAGSYLIALWEDGSVQAVHPVVVKSYEVTIDAPSAVESGEEVEFSVGVDNVAGTAKDLDSVQVVVSRNGDQNVLTATKSSDGTYTATTTLSAEGEYLVYANARGSNEVNGQKELLGASQSTEISVRDPTPTATATPTDSGGQNQAGSTESPTPTATDTATITETATATATATQTSESPTATSTATETATDNSVVTPNQQSPSPTTTTGSLSPVVTLLSVLGLGYLARNRNG